MVMTPKAIVELPEFLEQLAGKLRNGQVSLATSVEFTQKDERDGFGTRRLVVEWQDRMEATTTNVVTVVTPTGAGTPPPPNETVKKGG